MDRPGHIRIRLFGAFALRRADEQEVELRGSKPIALIAILATSPEGRRQRAWLQKALWGRSDEKHGRASLRQCLSSVKRVLGAETFNAVFHTTNDTVTLHPDAVEYIGTPRDGEFLEGIDIPTELFEAWVAEQRGRSSCPRRAWSRSSDRSPRR